jgi:hypothetical protein
VTNMSESSQRLLPIPALICSKLQGVFKKRPNFCCEAFLAHFTTF